MEENARYEYRKIDRYPTGKRLKTPFVYNILHSAFVPQAIEAKPRLPKSHPLDRTQSYVVLVTGMEWVPREELLCHMLAIRTHGHVGSGNSCGVVEVLPCRAVFPNRRAAARYRALASIIPGRER
jgi:hypothetical protein